MHDARHQPPGLLWLAANSNYLVQALAAAAMGVVGTTVGVGLSLPQVVAWLVVAAAALAVLYQAMLVLPTVLRTVATVALAVLCAIVATGWCMGHAAECAAFSDDVVGRAARMVAGLEALVRHIYEAPAA